MNVPRNALLFEALLYLSLILDTLSVAFEDRTPDASVSASTIAIATAMKGGLILVFLYLVWLAARQRRNWPRWVLAAALLFSVGSLWQAIDESGLELDSSIEIVSCLLTAAGLYFSFTGDAQDWFDA
jgi:hypothetical protein